MKDLKARKLSILLTALIAVFALSAFDCKKGTNGSRGEFTGALPGPVHAATAKGVRVRSNNPIDPAHLAKIDTGLDKAFRIASEPPNNYGPPMMQHEQFTVGLWPRSGSCINAGFLIRTTDLTWDNKPPPHDFDKGPAPGRVLLCIAGLTAYGNAQAGIPTGAYGMLVVDDAASMVTIIWFEAEHEILFGFDADKWAATMGLHAHPLMGEGNALQKAAGMQGWTFELPAAVEAEGFAAKKGTKVCVLLTK